MPHVDPLQPPSTAGVEGEDDPMTITTTTAEVEEISGVPIEVRVRPREKLPKGIVRVQHEQHFFRINFDRLDEVKEADPPPPTAEELEQMEMEKNRIASPLYYGRAEYSARPPLGSRSTTPQLYKNASNTFSKMSLSELDGLASPMHRRHSHFFHEESSTALDHSLSVSPSRHTVTEVGLLAVESPAPKRFARRCYSSYSVESELDDLLYQGTPENGEKPKQLGMTIEENYYDNNYFERGTH